MLSSAIVKNRDFKWYAAMSHKTKRKEDLQASPRAYIYDISHI